MKLISFDTESFTLLDAAFHDLALDVAESSSETAKALQQFSEIDTALQRYGLEAGRASDALMKYAQGVVARAKHARLDEAEDDA